MVSIRPYSKSYDNTHMYSFVDYRPHNNPKVCATDNSVFAYIYTNPKLTKFAKILRKANMASQYSNKSLNITLFVPLDEHLPAPADFYDTIDQGTARRILAVSSLNYKINGDLIRSSPVSNYITRDPYNRNTLYVTNINGITELNGCVHIVKFDIQTSNGLIHFTDGLLTPSDEQFIN